MEWLLFTYWLPPEPSRKRVFIWRQLKKIGALSAEGTGWLLPKTEPLLTAITDIIRSVEELEGTTGKGTGILRDNYGMPQGFKAHREGISAARV